MITKDHDNDDYDDDDDDAIDDGDSDDGDDDNDDGGAAEYDGNDVADAENLLPLRVITPNGQQIYKYDNKRQ